MAENLLNLSTLFSGDNIALNAEGAGLNYVLNLGSDLSTSTYYTYATTQQKYAKGQLISNLIPYDYSALSQQTNGLYLTFTGYNNLYYTFVRYMFEATSTGVIQGQNTFFIFYNSDKIPLGCTAVTDDGISQSYSQIQTSADMLTIAINPTVVSYTSGSLFNDFIPQDWSQVKYVRFNCYPISDNQNLANNNLITPESISSFQVVRGNTLAKTTADRLQKIIDTKAALKTALNSKGCNITDSTPFAEYATQAANIQTGITPTGTIDITTNGTVDVTNYATANVNVEATSNTLTIYFAPATNPTKKLPIIVEKNKTWGELSTVITDFHFNKAGYLQSYTTSCYVYHDVDVSENVLQTETPIEGTIYYND